MKRLATFFLILLVVLALSGCCISHSYQPATCTQPEICSKCGQEKGTALGHTEEIDPAVPATCTEDGLSEGVRCSVCGEVIAVQEVIPALGHKEEIDPAVPATCTEDGLTEGVHCSVCGEVLTAQEVVPALGHTEETDAAVLATCTENGLTEGVHCSVCGEVLTTQETVPAHGHRRITDKAVPATCTENGLSEGKHCAVCGEVLVAQEAVPALGHMEETDAAVPADCTKSGLTEGVHCSVCGEVLVAQEAVPALGHTEETDAAVPADCTKSGLTEGVHCSVCGEVLTTQETVPAHGHRRITDKAVPATCTENGLSEGKHCAVCGEVLVAQEAVPALGHMEETDAAVPADCTKSGLTEGVHCSVCGEVLVAQEAVPALGHMEETDAAVTADCTKSGLTEGVHCSVCGEVLTPQEVVPAVGHKEETDAAVAATCTKDGMTEGKHCAVCGEVLTPQEVVPAVGHKEETDAAVPVTCTKDGMTEGVHCSVCGEVLTAQEVIPATGHIMSYRTYLKPAVCKICGEEDGEAPYNRLFTDYIAGLFEKYRAGNMDAAFGEDVLKSLLDEGSDKRIVISGMAQGLSEVIDNIISGTVLSIDLTKLDENASAVGMKLSIPGLNEFNVVVTLNNEEAGAYFPQVDPNYYCASANTVAQLLGIPEPKFNSITSEKKIDVDAVEEIVMKYANMLFDIVIPENVEEAEGEYKFTSIDRTQACTILTITPDKERLSSGLKNILVTFKNDENYGKLLNMAATSSYPTSSAKTYGQSFEEYSASIRAQADNTIDGLIDRMEELTAILTDDFTVTVAFDGDGLYGVSLNGLPQSLFFETYRIDENSLDNVLGVRGEEDFSPVLWYTRRDDEMRKDLLLAVPGSDKMILLSDMAEGEPEIALSVKDSSFLANIALKVMNTEFSYDLPTEKVMLNTPYEIKETAKMILGKMF